MKAIRNGCCSSCSSLRRIEGVPSTSPDISNKAEGVHINDFPTEILSKILGNLCQDELVESREVCKHWRDLIDEHCPMPYVIIKDDEFFERKMQLRMKEVDLEDFDDDNSTLFAHPQAIRNIQFDGVFHVDNLRRLMAQVKPYIQSLNINPKHFEENFLDPPYVFPNLKEVCIQERPISPSTVTFDLFFSHAVPLLTKLRLHIFYREWRLMDEIHDRLFNCILTHEQTIKNLKVHFVMRRQSDIDPQEPYNLPNSIKRLLNSGKLQKVERLKVKTIPRYSEAWIQIIQRQEKLVKLSVTLDDGDFGQGFPLPVILPTISSNISTLRKIVVDHIGSVSVDGKWVPFDCAVIKDAVNLTKLALGRAKLELSEPSPHEIVGNGNEITNLGDIPLGSLKSFRVISYVCQSRELQSLVDNSPVLESLVLFEIRASQTSPKFASTGAHGGIIRSFMEKPTKKYIHVEAAMNFSSPEENEKLESVRRLYPQRPVRRFEPDCFSWESRFT